MHKVFVSATSRDLKSYRAVVAEWAAARGYAVVVQEDFETQPDFVTVTKLVRDKLDGCDAVIHLAGFYYGFEPANIPAGESRRSYTQLEFDLGREYKRRVFRFLAADGCPFDNECPEADDKRDLQRAHRERLTADNALYYTFKDRDHLKQLLAAIDLKKDFRPNNLPFASIGTLFKGRDAFMEQLRTALAAKATHIAAVTARQAVHGLGGVGKTRAAVEYGWRHETEYTALLFVTADSPENFERNLAALTGAMLLNLPEQDAHEQAVQYRAVVRWLREHAGWFLVVDNVDTPDAKKAVEKELLAVSTGHVVVTSRLANWRHGIESLDLDVLAHPDTGRLVNAEPLYRRAPGIFRANLGDDHPNTRGCQANYDILLRDMDQAE